MNVVARKTLKAFWTVHPNAEAVMVAWYDHVKAANWLSPQDIKNDFRSVDFVADNRVIFNVGGNNYRIVVRVSYEYRAVMIKFVSTHKEYDRIDPQTV